MKQSVFLKKSNKSYGGELLKTRKGRSQPRPLDTRNTMHLVLRSSKATGEWSFKKTKNEIKIREIVSKFSTKYGVRILSLANVGNHLHFQIKLSNRFAYKPFIRAITAAIAMGVTGTSRWNKLKKEAKDRFWDYRPFTRVVQSFRAFLNLRDYIQINQLEGLGTSRVEARFILESKSFRTAYGDSC
ncbi:MAG: transposase [Oligoflexia bacterium]|nr:transposase [Oligoflexia bacterium]